MRRRNPPRLAKSNSKAGLATRNRPLLEASSDLALPRATSGSHSTDLMPKLPPLLTCVLLCPILICPPACLAQSSPTTAVPEKVILDTDIGDDIDDAFAVALALRSPELQILGITTTFGDTETRAKLLDRFLAEAGRPEIPVAAGVPTPPRALSRSAATPRTTASPSPLTPTPSLSSSTKSAATPAKSHCSPSAP